MYPSFLIIQAYTSGTSFPRRESVIFGLTTIHTPMQSHMRKLLDINIDNMTNSLPRTSGKTAWKIVAGTADVSDLKKKWSENQLKSIKSRWWLTTSPSIRSTVWLRPYHILTITLAKEKIHKLTILNQDDFKYIINEQLTDIPIISSMEVSNIKILQSDSIILWIIEYWRPSSSGIPWWNKNLRVYKRLIFPWQHMRKR